MHWKNRFLDSPLRNTSNTNFLHQIRTIFYHKQMVKKWRRAACWDSGEEIGANGDAQDVYLGINFLTRFPKMWNKDLELSIIALFSS